MRQSVKKLPKGLSLWRSRVELMSSISLTDTADLELKSHWVVFSNNDDGGDQATSLSQKFIGAIGTELVLFYPPD